MMNVEDLSFRPLPGDLISQLEREFQKNSWRTMFPSPSRGSYFSITKLATAGFAESGFRPLPGDLISQFPDGIDEELPFN